MSIQKVEVPTYGPEGREVAASVAATTRFLAMNQQPMESVCELESIDVPVMILQGIDPEHPADVASLYAEHLRHRDQPRQRGPS